MTDDDIILTPLTAQDRKNILTALKTLAGLEASKLPSDFSPARLEELHELRDRLNAHFGN